MHLPCRFNGFIQEQQDLQQLLASQQRYSILHQQQRITQFNQYMNPNLVPQSPSDLNGGSTSNSLYQQQGQSHGLAQMPNYIQWYYHRRDNVPSIGHPVLQNRDKFILAADQGLVIMNANEPGWYQCRLGNQIIYSYNLIIDTSEYTHKHTTDLKNTCFETCLVGCPKYVCVCVCTDEVHKRTSQHPKLTLNPPIVYLETCAAPNEAEFKQVYADWCREMERYKSAYKNWHAKQNVSTNPTTSVGLRRRLVNLAGFID